MKIIKIITIILICFLMVSNVISYASNPVDNFKGNIDGGANDSKTAIVNIISGILNIVRIIGVSVSVSMLLVVACKYIIASAGDRADAKKYAINYIIGALILFGASGIITLAKKFIDSSLSTE